MKQSSLNNVIGTCFLIFTCYIAQTHVVQLAQKNEVVQQRIEAVVEPSITNALPSRLKIPSIGVDASIELVGVTPDGTLDVPNNIAGVGLFNLGPSPGEKGSAVIDGHLNGKKGDPGVFINLNQVKPGDSIYVEDTSGSSMRFVIREIRAYDPGHADEVFGRGVGTHLNLITCDGAWDTLSKSYAKRLVVFSDLEQ